MDGGLISVNGAPPDRSTRDLAFWTGWGRGGEGGDPLPSRDCGVEGQASREKAVGGGSQRGEQMQSCLSLATCTDASCR